MEFRFDMDNLDRHSSDSGFGINDKLNIPPSPAKDHDLEKWGQFCSAYMEIQDVESARFPDLDSGRVSAMKQSSDESQRDPASFTSISLKRIKISPFSSIKYHPRAVKILPPPTESMLLSLKSEYMSLHQQFVDAPTPIFNPPAISGLQRTSATKSQQFRTSSPETPNKWGPSYELQNPSITKTEMCVVPVILDGNEPRTQGQVTGPRSRIASENTLRDITMEATEDKLKKAEGSALPTHLLSCTIMHRTTN